MRTKAAAILCGAAMIFSCAPSDTLTALPICDITARAEEPSEHTLAKIVSDKGTAGSNVGSNSYAYNWSQVVRSYIYEDGGDIVRLEYTGSEVIAETFADGGKKLKSTKHIEARMPKFGGAYVGSKYNFLVFAVDNPDEDDTLEFLSIVKYDKSWNKLDEALVAAEEAAAMFDFGSLRMTESNGVLYIHTCFRHYKDSNGVSHQSSFTLWVNEEDMEWDREMRAYMSHSFNQFVAVEGDTEYLLDHGDCYDRSVRLTALSISDPDKYSSKIDLIKIGSTYEELASKTGVQLGGFGIGTGAVITAGCMTDQSRLTVAAQRNVFICVTDKSLSTTDTIMLTEYGDNSAVNVGCPQLAKLADGSFCVLWDEQDINGRTLKCVTIDGSGNILRREEFADGLLSDCAPVLFSDGMIKWYVTDGGSPVFYSLSAGNEGSGESKRIGGDANGDGKIDGSDVSAIMKTMCGWVIDINVDNADVNRDGKVDAIDCSLIQKHLCGWDITL